MMVSPSPDHRVPRGGGEERVHATEPGHNVLVLGSETQHGVVTSIVDTGEACVWVTYGSARKQVAATYHLVSFDGGEERKMLGNQVVRLVNQADAIRALRIAKATAAWAALTPKQRAEVVNSPEAADQT